MIYIAQKMVLKRPYAVSKMSNVDLRLTEQSKLHDSWPTLLCRWSYSFHAQELPSPFPSWLHSTYPVVQLSEVEFVIRSSHMQVLSYHTNLLANIDFLLFFHHHEHVQSASFSIIQSQHRPYSETIHIFRKAGFESERMVQEPAAYLRGWSCSQ